ncbi:MAG: superoxide dismutase [Candidatus Pacebacteria bacterium]|nr:superoxide dismutase [Candidatus Paceibacterota bacterium]
MLEMTTLPYAYDALEPYIDEATMRVHHDKHHQAYFDKYKQAWESLPELKDVTVEQVLWRLNDLNGKIDDSVWLALKNHGGGFFNHNLFWEIMSPDGVRTPTGELKNKIEEMGGLPKLKEDFKNLALGQFGSGWAWLVVDEQKQLQMYALANQDSPLSLHHQPILGVDVWEHAYYLKYQNRRADYLDAWWQVVDFSAVEKRYLKALANK